MKENYAPQTKQVIRHIGRKLKGRLEELTFPVALLSEGVIFGAKMFHAYPSLFREGKLDYSLRLQKDETENDILSWIAGGVNIIGMGISVFTLFFAYNMIKDNYDINALCIPIATNCISGLDELRRYYNKSKKELTENRIKNH